MTSDEWVFGVFVERFLRRLSVYLYIRGFGYRVLFWQVVIYRVGPTVRG